MGMAAILPVYPSIMCDRYYRRSDKQRLAEHFDAKPTPGLTTRYSLY